MTEELVETADQQKPAKKHIDHRWSVGIIATLVLFAAIVGTFIYVYNTNKTADSLSSIQTIVVSKPKQETTSANSATTQSTESSVTNSQLNSEYQTATNNLSALDSQTSNVDSSLNDTPVNLTY